MNRWGRLLSISFLVYLNFIEYVKSEITSANSPLPAVKEHDVLAKAIKIPFEDPNTLYFDQGLDGFPAFGVLPGSDIKVPYRSSLPEKLYPEFSITCTIAVKSQNGGFVFAVVNPLETVVEFGIQVHPVETNRMNISLFYTDIGKFSSSKIIGSFLVPYYVGKFIKFAIQVTGDSISLFHNCLKVESLYMKRDTNELLFDPASILYVGQAGPIIKGNLDMLPGIKGAPNSDTSKDIAITETEGFLHWIPNWVRTGYNRLFGDDGMIASVIPGLFGRPEKDPIQCCCVLPQNENQPTSENDMNVRDVSNHGNEKQNNCVKVVGHGAKDCSLATAYACNFFIVKTCEAFAGLAGGLIYGALLGCTKVVKCFSCGGSAKKKRKAKNNSNTCELC